LLLKSVHVEHFRSIKNETLECDPLTVLVGPNGAGKSTFLQAIRVFYDITARLGIEDFYGRRTEQPIVIRATYGDLRDDELDAFKPYVQQGLLTVTKRIAWADGKMEQKYFGSAEQVPAFAPIRAARTKTEQISQWNEVVESGVLRDIAEKAKRGQDVEALMRDYETAHPDVQPIEKEEQFFGPRNIGGGKLDNYTKFVYLPAVRDVAEETMEGKGATLHQRLDTLVLRKIQSRPEVQELKTEFTERLKAIYNPANIAELSAVATEISATLKDFVPGATFQLEFGDAKLPEIPVPPAVPTLSEDDFPGDITRKGHELQRALIFTLLQHLALARRPDDMPAANSRGEESGDGAPDAASGPDLILAIEEPELYQHPQRCRYLADLLFDLAKDPEKGLGARNQVLHPLRILRQSRSIRSYSVNAKSAAHGR